MKKMYMRKIVYAWYFLKVEGFFNLKKIQAFQEEVGISELYVTSCL